MKIYQIFTLIILLIATNIQAQKLSDKELAKFAAAEKLLVDISNEFSNDSLPFERRVNLIHEFIPKLVAILKEKNSFYYPFSAFETVGIVEAPDNTFKIFTWQLKEPLGTHRYYGTMQMQGETLKLFPFQDFSDTMEVHPQTILSPNNWYGGLYYKCILKEYNNQKTYTLFAYDKADFVSTRKFLEILRFNEKNEPVFGAPIILFHDSLDVLIDKKSRFFREFSDKASAKLNYDDEMDLIIYDHLVPQTEKEEGAYFNYVPDGTYSGFKWENGNWVWVEKIFHYSINHPDNPPMPSPKFGDPKPSNPVFDK